jgi:hypothetical protein
MLSASIYGPLGRVVSVSSSVIIFLGQNGLSGPDIFGDKIALSHSNGNWLV